MAPVDVIVVGTALNTQGFTAFNTIDGIGLVTFGFLWSCEGIWANSEFPITTVWSDPTSTSTEVCTD